MTPQQVLPMFRTMHLIRAFEEAVGRAFQDGRIRGQVHRYVGREAIAAGVCANLRATDYLSSHHRGHGHAIAKGADLGRLMRELFGREGGSCGGKGGSMHIADFSVGMLGANGVLADGVTIAMGAAHAVKLLRQDRIVVAFFGDGAVNRGPLLEALNWAVVYNLPVLFVCEDNQYTNSVRTAEFTGGEGIVARGRSFGLACESVDGNDVIAVHDLAEKLAGRVRRRDGPTLMHALCYRGYGHFAKDNGVYRDEEAQKKALAADPIERCRTWLAMQGANRSDLERIRADAAMQVDKALKDAEAAPPPWPQDAFTQVQDLGADPWPR
jgi:pyruvate dehydrogenase E1 component alpha subunit